ncbi:hypothetical protein ACI782_12880 [Geodermatophilus sp. SYSU D00703]
MTGIPETHRAGTHVADGMFDTADALVRLRAASVSDAARPVPEPVLTWLVRLRLLHGVPFQYLVSDSRLLPPPESVRFFYVDRNWTDAACDGAMSVAAGSAERAHLKARHTALRDSIDRAERNHRHTSVHSGEELDAPPDTPITGFLLRSRLVSGWPGLQIRASRKAQTGAMSVCLLRLGRLAPAVLLAMFDGIPDVVTLEEPHQGVQFGLDERTSGGGYEVPARDGEPATGPVPFRPGAPGVIDVAALAHLLGVSESAPLARRLLQFPFRQDFSAVPKPGDVVFAPSITLTELDAAFGDIP